MDCAELKAKSFRMEEVQVLDMEFLHCCVQPTIILIYEDHKGRHVTTHEISLKDHTFVKTPWERKNIDSEASLIIPLPGSFSGAIIVGQETIFYNDEIQGPVATPLEINYVAVRPPAIKQSSICCYAKVDSNGSRYLLGDLSGRIFLLLVQFEEKVDDTIFVKDIEVEVLGEASIPTCITYIDNGIIFIGSMLGDSQLIKLSSTKPVNKNSSCMSVMATFANLAPISDMAFLVKQGQAQLVTCSGALQEGSLRIIIKGVEIQEHASWELKGIIGMWPLKMGMSTEFDNTLVLSFIQQTRVFSLNGDEISESEIYGFQTDCQTYYCGNVSHDQVVQVTSFSARLIANDTKLLVQEWRPPNDRNISVVASNQTHVLCATGINIYYLEIGDKYIDQKAHVQMEYDVACMDISLLDAGNEKASIAAVGLWTDNSARILKLPSLEELNKETLGGDFVPRSILVTCFEGIDYLLCALGDGSMIYFHLIKETGVMTNKKKIFLGTQPTILRTFGSSAAGTRSVFARSNISTLIHSLNQKLIFANVNVQDVFQVCSLHAEAYPDSFAFSTKSTLTIGSINVIQQKMHSRTISLGESPRSIAYQESSETFGVTTMRLDVMRDSGLRPARSSAITLALNKSCSAGTLFKRFALPSLKIGQETEVHNLLIVDQHTFKVLHSHQLIPYEYALSVISAQLGDDPRSYYVVGTALVNPEESYPKVGRIIVFLFQDGKLTQVSEKEINGMCYCLLEFNGKLLAAINSTVHLFEWTAEKELRLECSQYNFVLSLFLKAKGDFILVGDLMKSMTLVHYKTMEGILAEIARDFIPNRMTAVEFIDDETFLGGEKTSNIFVCKRKDIDGITDEEEEQCLQESGQFHLGDSVQVFRHGYLTMQQYFDTSLPTEGCILFGTLDGAIGLLTQITQEFYEFLTILESRLVSVIESVGKIEHSFWRSFKTDLKTEPRKNFIDGDLVECFLDMPREAMEEICVGLLKLAGSGQDVTVDELVYIVKELVRIH